MTRLLLRLLDMAGFGSVEQVMRHSSFRLYLLGTIPNVVGVWVVRTAIGWLGWELTHSSFWVGALAAADAMPVLLLGPLGGVLADRFDRRKISIGSQSILCAIAVALTVMTVTGSIAIWSLFALALARGITFAFWQPVRLALMPNLVPRSEIPIAIALNSSTFNTAQFVGPAFAALLLTLGGAGLAFAFNIVAAGAMVWTLMAIRMPARPASGAARRTMFAEAAEGIRYCIGHRGIGPMLLFLVVLGVGIRPATELLPGFADRVFGLAAGGYSMMVSAVGVGAMTGAIWMLRRGNAGSFTMVALRAGLLGGAAALAFALTDRVSLAVLFLALLGFSMTSGGIATQQAVQMAVPDEMRGRVLSVFGMLFRAGPAAGALLMGWIADAAGLAWPVAIGAAVGIAVYIYANTRRTELQAALEAPAEGTSGVSAPTAPQQEGGGSPPRRAAE